MGSTAEEQGPLLTKARKVVEQTMSHGCAQVLFNEPVDPEALGLPDYFDVIKEPMDLGTVYRRLDKKKKKYCFYKSVEEAYRDVCLVWSNCYEYNVEDKEVCSMCDQVAEYFELLWASAGLPKFEQAKRGGEHAQSPTSFSVDATEISAAEERDGVEELPEGYSMMTESEPLPLRLLDDFTVHTAQDPNEIVSLHDMKLAAESSTTTFAMRGRALHLDPASTSAPVDIEIPLVTDWCIEYNTPPEIWVLSPHAWYKLQDPAPEYEENHRATLLKAELVAQVALAGKRGTQPKSLAEREEVQRDADFLIPELKAWSEEAARKREHGRDMARKVALFITQLEAGLMSIKDQKRQALTTPQPLGRRQRNRVATFASGVDSDDEYHPAPKKTVSKTPNSKYVSAAEEQRLWAEWKQRAEEARGVPPEPSRNYKLPMDWVGDVIMIWDFTQTFGALMQIPPYPLWRLEAAIAPMPLVYLESSTEEPGPITKGEDKEKGEYEGSEDRGIVERSSKRQRLMEVGATLDGGAQGIDEKVEVEAAQTSLAKALADESGIASAALLRDIHLGMLAVLDGSAAVNASGTSQPKYSKPEAREGSGPYWPERVHDVLNKSSCNWAEEFPVLPDAMKYLQAGTYCFTTPRQRLAILKALHYLVMKQDLIRSYYQTELESIAAIAKAAADAAKPPLPPKPTAATENSGAPPEPPAPPQPASPPSPLPDSIAAWMRWRCIAGLGIGGIFLGEDLQRRRYWVLGGQAGAWMVHVEAADGSQWGCYNGSAARKLLAWLKSSPAAPPEVGLLAALSTAPLPPWRKDTPRVEGSVAEGDTDSAGGATDLGAEGNEEALELDNTLEARRMDGYKLLVAPLTVSLGDDIRGFNIPLPSYIYLMANGLLSRGRFWEQDEATIASHIQILHGIGSAGSVPFMIAHMLKLEEHLRCNDCLTPAWDASGISTAWRSVLTECTAMSSLVNLMERLHVYARYQDPTVSRGAFLSMVEYLNCQLYFPCVGETVILLRSGCKLHLENYLSGSLRGSAEYKLVSELLERVCQLRPAQRYVVVSVAYLGTTYSSDVARKMLGEETEFVEPKEEEEAEDGKVSTEEEAVTEGKEAMETVNEEDVAGLEIPRVWLLLAPARNTVCTCVNSAPAPIAVPIPVDIELPDFLVPGTDYERAARNVWEIGERFRMFFGSKKASRADDGDWYKGSIVAFRSNVDEGASESEYDPWESIVVDWEGEQESGQNKVSPWEIERTPEDERKRQLEIYRREQEAAAQAAEIAARKAAYEQLLAARRAQIQYQQYQQAQAKAKAQAEAQAQAQAQAKARHAQQMQQQSHARQVNGLGAQPVRCVPLPVVNSLQRENFLQMLEHHCNQVGKKFKIPVFAHMPLDLYTVFIEVQKRGGYQAVTNSKQWKEIARALPNIDLKGQTSASFNMRLNYEKCLLDFEAHLCAAVAAVASGAISMPGMPGQQSQDTASAALHAASAMPAQSQHNATAAAQVTPAPSFVAPQAPAAGVTPSPVSSAPPSDQPPPLNASSALPLTALLPAAASATQPTVTAAPPLPFPMQAVSMPAALTSYSPPSLPTSQPTFMLPSQPRPLATSIPPTTSESIQEPLTVAAQSTAAPPSFSSAAESSTISAVQPLQPSVAVPSSAAPTCTASSVDPPAQRHNGMPHNGCAAASHSDD